MLVSAMACGTTSPRELGATLSGADTAGSKLNCWYRRRPPACPRRWRQPLAGGDQGRTTELTADAGIGGRPGALATSCRFLRCASTFARAFPLLTFALASLSAFSDLVAWINARAACASDAADAGGCTLRGLVLRSANGRGHCG